MIPIETVHTLLKTAFPEDEIYLDSPMRDNNHFECVIVSDRFEGKSPVQQHQLVYKALGNLMQEALHALALRTYTRQEWAAIKEKADT